MIVCPNCGYIFENDTEIEYSDEFYFDYETGTRRQREWYECPKCSERYNDVEAFYE